MKQLICRDIYLIRKNLLITFGIFLAFFLFGLLAVLSARYGNIAKYSEDIEFTGDVIETSLYFTILGAIILGTVVEHVTGILHKDYTIGWHQYMKATHFKAEKIVGAKFILIYVLSAISFVVGTLNFIIMEYISGRSMPVGYLVIVAGTIILVSLGSFYTVLEYVYKGRASKKADLIRVCPIIIFMVTGLGLMSDVMPDTEKLEKLFEIAKSFMQYKVLLYLIPLLEGFIISFICYLVSVWLVKREGKCI